MSSYIIEGGKKLQGETYVTGSKNASLPIMAASLLNKGITKLYNVPNIHDTQMMIEILKSLGCKVKKNQNKVVIDSKMILICLAGCILFLIITLINYNKKEFV